METSTILHTPTIENDYKNFILNDEHPCIMAKALFKMNKYTFRVYDDLGSAENMRILLQDLAEYLDRYNFESDDFESFIASFPNNIYEDELSFERALWNALQMLHDADDQQWDETVRADPENPNFSFSLKGRAFYIVGLHPNSSRIARQAPYPTLVFNLHLQFEKLRELGTYNAVRDTIRQNDKKLQGSINPVLRDFGSDTEAKQYSGRAVESNWKCPFHHK